ncbi:MAG: serine protease [Planctomycetales bacterium]|nr:serine protease [Planctomycetales bacterium]
MKRAILNVAMGAAMAAGPGCSALDSVTESLVRAGVLAPRASDAGVPSGAVVEVETGGARGTGVALGGGLVLTAAHVVEGAARATIARPAAIPGALPERERAGVVWRDPVGDVALLSAPGAEESADSGPPEPGPAWVVTLERSGTTALGDPTWRPAVRRATVLENGRFEVEGGVRRGDSGSPILQRGRVVGVVRSADRYASVAPAVAWIARRNAYVSR